MGSSKSEYILCDLDSLKNKKVVCLTLDVEQDYGADLAEPSYEGLRHIPDLVNFFKQRDVPLTCFVQGSLFESHPVQIEQLSALDAEFELHSYSHPKPKKRDTEFEVKRGKEAYREFFGKDPVGYRAPLGVINDSDYQVLAGHGFKFDSSIFPSLRPGVFNELRKPRKPYFLNNHEIVEFPVTVFSGIARIPVGLSYIKLLGQSFLLKTFDWPNLVVCYFHLHDLFELDSANKLPLRGKTPLYRLIFRRIYQKQRGIGFAILDRLVTAFQRKGYTFSRLDSIYESIAGVMQRRRF